MPNFYLIQTNKYRNYCRVDEIAENDCNCSVAGCRLDNNNVIADCNRAMKVWWLLWDKQVCSGDTIAGLPCAAHSNTQAGREREAIQSVGAPDFVFNSLELRLYFCSHFPSKRRTVSLNKEYWLWAACSLLSEYSVRGGPFACTAQWALRPEHSAVIKSF